MRRDAQRIGIEWTVPTWRKARSATCAAVIALLIVATAGGTSVAASAATGRETTVTNTARLAEPLHVRLEEPAWSDGADEDENGIPDIAQTAIPGQAIPKDPRVTNESTMDAWMFMTVSIPMADVRMSLGTSASEQARRELFSFEANRADWDLLDRTEDEGDAMLYTFAYPLVAHPYHTTPPLFEEIVMGDIVDGDLADMRAQNVIVTAFGIQAKGFDNPASAWEAYVEQNDPFSKGALA